jgi:hypothetical protein
MISPVDLLVKTVRQEDTFFESFPDSDGPSRSATISRISGTFPKNSSYCLVSCDDSD